MLLFPFEEKSDKAGFNERKTNGAFEHIIFYYSELLLNSTEAREKSHVVFKSTAAQY